MISAPYPGRLPGEEGGLLLSQQLGHLVLFLQRMPCGRAHRRIKRDELPGLPEADGALRLLRSTNHPVRASHRPPGGK